MTSNAPSAKLDYVPGGPVRRRRRIRRTICIGLILAAGIGGYLFHDEAWRIAKIHYYQWQCGNYAAPTDQLVLLQNEAGTPTAPNGSGYIIPPWNSSALEQPSPSQLQQLIAAYQASPAFPALEPEGTVFLHNLTDPAGHRRLVWAAVDTKLAPTNLYSSDHVIHVRLNVRVFPDFAFLPPAACMGLPVQRSPTVQLGIANGNLRVYASQVDPADASHFTVRYDVGGTAHAVDVRLKLGGNVVIAPR